jgi:Eco29kI restriction endonuclease
VLEVFSIPEQLAEELVKFYKRQDYYPLSELPQHRDSLRLHVGVYLLFYHGNYPLYEKLSKINKDKCLFPIYVGKAVESGRRKGAKLTNNQSLYGRLMEHRRSINQVEGLSVDEFSFRVIAMQSDLVTWGEATMIRYFQPIWNQIIDGFGIHAPGKGRYEQRQSVWDVLHPGRGFTKKMLNLSEVTVEELKEQIESSCRRFLSENKS